MLGTTILLYSTAHRLSGRKAALFSCALWLACEPNLRMGGYATYDPMAIFLSAWPCGRRSRRQAVRTMPNWSACRR
jgi:hypothetical protein